MIDSDKLLVDLTVRDLKLLIRDVIREELSKVSFTYHSLSPQPIKIASSNVDSNTIRCNSASDNWEFWAGKLSNEGNIE